MPLPVEDLPDLDQSTVTEDPKILACLQELQQILSGGVDDTNLASPNAGVWRLLDDFQMGGYASFTGGTVYVHTGAGGMAGGFIQSGGQGSRLWKPPTNLADLTVPGKTAKARLAADLIVAGGAHANSIKVRLQPVTGFTVSSNQVVAALGAQVLEVDFTAGGAANTFTAKESAVVDLSTLNNARGYVCTVTPSATLVVGAIAIAIAARLEIAHQ